MSDTKFMSVGTAITVLLGAFILTQGGLLAFGFYLVLLIFILIGACI